jgi:hypothetical protein
VWRFHGKSFRSTGINVGGSALVPSSRLSFTRPLGSHNRSGRLRGKTTALGGLLTGWASLPFRYNRYRWESFRFDESRATRISIVILFEIEPSS